MGSGTAWGPGGPSSAARSARSRVSQPTRAPRETLAAPAPGPEPLSIPTYHRDVALVLARGCTKCHYEGGIGPSSLMTSVIDGAGSLDEMCLADVLFIEKAP